MPVLNVDGKKYIAEPPQFQTFISAAGKKNNSTKSTSVGFFSQKGNWKKVIWIDRSQDFISFPPVNMTKSCHC